MSGSATNADLHSLVRHDSGPRARADAMDPRHLLELREKEASYWWHVNKRRVVLSLLDCYAGPGASILEVGCGGGYLATVLAERGLSECAADVSPDAVRFARDNGATGGAVFDATLHWPLSPASFDVVLMLDVLEHLDDDVTALIEAQRVLRPGGAVLLTVPAHPLLFSTWDALVGHRRRYTRRRLNLAARCAGLKVDRITAWNLVSLAPAVLLRTRDRLFGSTQSFAEFPAVSPMLNACLKWLGRIEGRLCKTVNLRLGLSLAAVLSKNQERS